MSSPALSTCPLPCGSKAAWFWEEAAVEEEQHVCLPAGFNLKHMYWLPFVVPAQIRDHNSPVSVPLDLGQTLAQRGDLDPFPCPPPPVAQESGLDICPLDRIIVLVPLGSQQLPTQPSYGSQGLACVLWSHCCGPSLSAPPATSLIPVTSGGEFRQPTNTCSCL